MKNSRYLFIPIGLILFFFTSPIFSQSTYNIESEAITGIGANTPFWMMSNRHGIASIDKNNGYLRAGVFNTTNVSNSLNFHFGLDIVETHNYTSKFILQQAFCDIDYKKFELSIGSKEYPGIQKNQLLSSGGMSWSGNARPIPMVRLSTPKYISFPWLFHNALKVKAAVAFGWFTDGDYQARTIRFDSINKNSSYTNTYTKNVLYHQKEFSLMYNFPKSAWSITFDGQLENQFCGDRYYVDHNVIKVISTPITLKHYWMILIPSQGDSQSPTSDQVYAFGNTLGSELLTISYHPKDYEIKGYIENFFEDFSGMSKQNGFDGLWGLEYASQTKQGITGVVLEYLQTTDQSGPIHWAPSDYKGTNLTNQATGNDDYYNNGNYTGWEHWGMTNGNPLLSSPIYNTDGTLRIQNNRVKAFHIGLSAALNHTLDARILTTYSQGWGRHYLPFEKVKTTTSALIELNYSPSKLNGWRFTASTAIDRGTLYGDNSALSLKISKKGSLFAH